MKVSEYIAQFLLEREITQCFSVTGGFAMHLNDSFGAHLNVVYPHGENPAGYAAIGWSKMTNKPSVVCVTSGCGTTNAVTPCLIAYQDSTPIFFISGGVPHKESIRTLQHSTRTYSGSDCDIIDMVKNITKYCVNFTPESDIQFEMEKLYWYMTSNRPGPVWIHIPLDIQSMVVKSGKSFEIPNTLNYDIIFPFDIWQNSKRPVILVGNGIHLSNTSNELNNFVQKHNIPVVSSYFGTDLVPDYNVGRVGILGDRTGNMTLQNADFVLCLGCRINKSIIGYRPEWFCREATIVSINIEDIDIGQTIKIDLRNFFSNIELPLKMNHEWWLEKTRSWKKKWGRELPNPTSNNCPYTFLNKFFDIKPPGETCVASSGSIFCVAWHQYLAKPGDRYLVSSHGDMGFELPAAIGASIASKNTVWSIVGDGSFQFNLQELQTIKSLNLPVKILYFNNGGYGAIRITQDMYFQRRFGVEIDCPDIQLICHAYGIKYFSSNEIETAIVYNGPCLVEVVCEVQQRHPRLMNKMNEDGTFVNTPMEDMYPFLNREEFRANMFVKDL
jgi:acetolactate synthase-1/2/3 large subunit